MVNRKTDLTEDRYPDLEIYIKRITAIEVIAWLESSFRLITKVNIKDGASCQFHAPVNGNDEVFDCIIKENSVKGGFTSVWFKSNLTHWKTDQDCAQQACGFFRTEVRCSTGAWQGHDEGGWLRFTEEGKKTVNWFT